MDRRDFLKATAVAGAGLAIGGVVAGTTAAPRPLSLVASTTRAQVLYTQGWTDIPFMEIKQGHVVRFLLPDGTVDKHPRGNLEVCLAVSDAQDPKAPVVVVEDWAETIAECFRDVDWDRALVKVGGPIMIALSLHHHADMSLDPRRARYVHEIWSWSRFFADFPADLQAGIERYEATIGSKLGYGTPMYSPKVAARTEGVHVLDARIRRPA